MDPIAVNLKGNLTYYSVPQPGAGLLIASILSIMDELISPMEETAKEQLTYHRIAEVFKYVHGQQMKDLEQVGSF